MNRAFFFAILLASPLLAQQTRELPADVLADKIHGAILGQIFGNLNGLQHEMKYIHEPGKVETYTPGLPDGARTDDDTDIEWIYHVYMEKENKILLPPDSIRTLWNKHLNRGIWCANLYARGLMDLGIDPPLTGRIALNPWAVFNIWAQFGVESFATMGPGMPQTACKIGLHYSQVSTDGEPSQVTQFLCTMISSAYFESDIDKLMDAGLRAVDPKSEFHALVKNVRAWHKENPNDWRKTRQLIRDTYTRYNGEMPDKNGVLLNTACVVAGLLYGQGDLSQTLRHCFSFGWDADNTAASAASIIGLIKGRKWIEQQGWPIKDIYKNTTRDGMPMDETVTGYCDRVVRLARKVILENGGKLEEKQGREVFLIPIQSPANIHPLPDPLDRADELTKQLLPQIEKDLTGDAQAMARAAYLAIALDQAPRLAHQQPEKWARAIAALNDKYPQVVTNLHDAPQPRGPILKQRAAAAGLEKPARRK